MMTLTFLYSEIDNTGQERLIRTRLIRSST